MAYGSGGGRGGGGGNGGGRGGGGNRGGGGRQQYDNEKRGVLFDNAEKRGDNDPDLRGQIEVDGVQYWLAAWWNNHPDKGDYLKLQMQEKEDRSPQQQNRSRGQQQRGPQRGQQQQRGGGGEYQDNGGDGGQRTQPGPGDEMDDDIPF